MISESMVYCSGIISYFQQQNCSINDVSLKESQFQSISTNDNSFNGGISAYGYSSQEYITDIIIAYTTISGNSTKQVSNAGITGSIKESKQTINNAQIFSVQILSKSQIDIWSGGIFGALLNSNLIISHSSFRNSNIY
ncbi:Hypothetical_protein [Hexamita inflata]|uniref:Hypothetical_protein n=1 Tax=Hexamita inflata TaxID=28002 RepID=A0AA86PFA8_9EUKA|nr:Hypothetical protein HINF_LOCUS23948 [Hexamita inflata]